MSFFPVLLAAAMRLNKKYDDFGAKYEQPYKYPYLPYEQESLMRLNRECWLLEEAINKKLKMHHETGIFIKYDGELERLKQIQTEIQETQNRIGKNQNE